MKLKFSLFLLLLSFFGQAKTTTNHGFNTSGQLGNYYFKSFANIASGTSYKEKFVKATNLSALADITIVTSGGAAEGTTWLYANNTIYPTSEVAVNLNVSDLLAKKALGDLIISAKSITVNADIIDTTNSNTLTLNSTANLVQYNQIKIKGALSMFAQNVSSRANLETTNSGAAILLKANAIVGVEPSVNITTNSGNIILWTNYLNTTSGTQNHEVYLGGTNTLSSNGGKIVLAGGLDNGSNGGVANDNIPDGYTYRAGYSGSAVDIRNNVKLLSADGDVIIRGDADPGLGTFNGSLRGYGIEAQAGFVINSGTGTITIDGKNKSDHAVAFLYGQFAITSASIATNAITITGATTNNFAGFIANFEANSGSSLIQTTGATGGNILVQGRNGSQGAFGQAIWLGANDSSSSLQILSTSGDIDLVSNRITNINNQNVYLGNRKNATAVQTIVPVATAATGNITFKAAALTYANTNGITIGTSGQVKIEPYGTSFTAATTIQNLILSSNATRLTIGKSANTFDITLNSAINIAGPITVYGNDITVNENLTSSAANAAILLKGTRHITIAASKVVTTAGGDVTFWGNSDATGAGYVQLYSNATVTTNGGAIAMGGGANVLTDYAKGVGTLGTASTLDAEQDPQYNFGISGVHFRRGVSLNSNGGNITLNGENGNSSESLLSYGAFLNNATINSGSGKITVLGKALGTGAVNAQAITTQGLSLQSSNTATDAITITGDATAVNSNQTSLGVNFNGNMFATGGGGIIVTGKSGTGVGYDKAAQLTGSILANTGPITLIGENDNSQIGLSLGNLTLGSKAATAVTSSASTITITSNNLELTPTNAVNTSGNVKIEPYGTDFTAATTLQNLTLSTNATSFTVGKTTGADGTSDADITINSVITTTGPISIYGKKFTIGNGVNITSTTGDITLKGSNGFSSAGTTRGTIQSNSGTILVSADADANASGLLDIDYLTFDSGSGNVIVEGYTFSWSTVSAATKPEFKGTGGLTIRPAGTSFGAAFNTSWVIINALNSSLTFGKLNNTADIDVASNISVAGPISVYGGYINVTATLTSTANGDILLKGNANSNNSVYITSGGVTKSAGTGTLTMQANGRAHNGGTISATGSAKLNLVMWSDYDGDNVGGGVSHHGTISTNGGHVWMGGSNSNGGSYNWNGLAVGDGPSIGAASSNANAIDMFGNITTSGGDFLVWAGNGYAGGLNGIVTDGSKQINVGNGDIVLITSSVLGANNFLFFKQSGGTFTLVPNGTSFPSALNWSPYSTTNAAMTGSGWDFPGDFDYLWIENPNTLTNLSIGSYNGMTSGGTPVVMTNTSTITIGSATTIGGAMSFYGGNIAVNSALTATNNNITLNASGAVTQTAAITATNLELAGTGTFTLTNTSNNVGTIAGGTSLAKLGSLSYIDSNALTIGAITNPGIIASGKIDVQTLTNNLTLSNNVVTDNTTTDAIILNAGKSASIAASSGGDIIVSGTPSVTTGTNGIAKLFSGTNENSTGLTSLAGGNENTRYYYDENSSSFSPVLVNGNKYALYRYNNSPPGNSLHFDGSNDYVNTNTNIFGSSVANFTMECWIKPDAASADGNYHGFLGGDAPGGRNPGIWVISNKIHCSEQAGGFLSSTAVLNQDKWNHVAWVKTGANNVVYVNGKSVGTWTTAATSTIFKNYTIGYIDNLFSGNIDEVRFWNTSLSLNTIQANMYNEVSPSSTGLVHYYKFNSGTGTSLIDSVPTGASNGTLIDFALTGTTSNWVESYAMVVPTAFTTTNASATSFTANWTAPAAGIVNAYLLDVSTSPNFETFISGFNGKDVGAVTTSNVTGLTTNAGNSYYWRVRANKTSVTGQGAHPLKGAIGIAATPPGNALNFDGSNDYVSLPNVLTSSVANSSNNAITIEYWFKGSNVQSAVRLQNGSDYIIAGYGGTLGAQQHILSNDGGSAAGAGVNVGASVTDGKWHHVAMTWQRNTVNGFKSYLDGELVQQRTSSNNALPNITANGFLGIVAGGNDPLNGSLDEVRMYNVVRSQSEIQADMYSTATIDLPAGLLAYYKMDQGTAAGTNTGLTNLVDQSANVFTGTLSNFALTGATSNWVESYAQITPTNVTTTAIAPTSFTANWAASSLGTATSYVIDVATDTAFSNLVAGYSAKNVGNVLTTPITGLSNSTKYYWRVRADKTSVTGTGNYTAYQTVTTTFQKPGKALNFDGVNDRVIATGTQPATNMTVEAWVRSSSTALQEIVGFSSSNSNKVTEFRLNGNKLCVGTNGNNASAWNELCGNTSMNTGRWTHVALVKTGTSYSLYVNGVLDVSGTINHIDPVTDRITIGSYHNNGSWGDNYTFNGNIDEVRIWNVAKTQAELQANMYDEISASTTGLVRYYNFNTTSDGGATLTDSVTTGPANGTLTNFALTGTTSNWVESYAMVVPTTPNTTGITNSGFTANWTAPVPGTVDNYLLDVATDNAFTSLVAGYNALNIGNVTSYNVTGLNDGITYYWRVRAHKTSVTAQAGYSTTVTLTTPQEALNVTSTTTTNSLNLLTNAAVIVDPNIAINYTRNITGFSVVLSNGKQNGDVLSYTGTLPSGISATAYNSSTGVLSFTGTTSAANWQALLRTVTFRAYTNAGVNRSISFSAGILNSFNNGHYYEFVSASGGTWTNAKAGAAAKRYLNYTGYLATITSQAENDYIKQILNSDSWIGASCDYNLLNALLGANTYASQSAANGKWYWVTGPEAGTQFMTSNTGNINGRYSNWASGEPNSTGGESFGGLYANQNAKWNDFSDTNTSLGGYIVEYGGLPSDIVQTPSYSLTMSVSGTPPGNALSFDGTNDYIYASTLVTNPTAFTLEAWFNTSASESGGIIGFNKDQTNTLLADYDRLLWIGTDGKIYFGVYNGTTNVINSTASYNDGKYHHVAVSFGNSTGMKLYIDGALIASNSLNNVSAYNGYWKIGGFRSWSDGGRMDYFNGKIDEVRIWNTVRSLSEIQNNMYNVVAPTASDLSYYYNFDQGIPSGTNTGNATLFDQTTNANNGTMSGFALSGTTSNWVESYAIAVPKQATTNAVVYNGFTANWSASTIGSFDNYILEVSTNTGFTSFVTGYNNKNVGTDTSFAITGLLPNTTYYWRVRADKTTVTGQGGYSTQTVLTAKEPINITSTTTSNSFNLLSNSAVVVDSNLTINYSQNIDGFRVIINTNKQDGDVLAYTGTVPSGITPVAYNATTGVLAFTGTTSAANWQTFLRTVTFRAYKNSGAARGISFSAGALNSFSNGHFYEYLPASLTWANAKTAAAARTYLNYAGYLTTVTSADENAFIKQILSADAWMGASDDYTFINAATGASTFGSQSGTNPSEGKWYWVTGPEAGTQFMTANGSNNLVAGKYTNWYTLSSEPNNSVSNEHYGQFYSTNNGTWNDLNGTSTLGYIVEYGGLTSDIVQTPSYSLTMNVSSTEPGNALDFDGTSDYVNLGNKLSFPAATPFTIEAWVNRKTAGNGIVVSKHNGGVAGQYYIKVNTDGTVLFHREISPWNLITTTAVPTNKWSHIAATYNGTTMTIYINGVASGSVASGTIDSGKSAEFISIQNNQNLNIGAKDYNGAPTDFFGGKIDEVRFWSVARTQAEIVANMVTPISPSTANLLSYYNFNEGNTNGTNTGLTTIYDQTASLNNGTLNTFSLSGTSSNWVESYAMVAPTTTAATSKYSLGFTANWTASSTGTTEKYYLDVATDAAFTSLVSGYSNKDVGTVTSFAVNTGLSANTTYYYRVRAEKASVTGTGANSNVTSVTTNVVETLVATAAADRTSVSFTANWTEPTLHNISAYLLDVSTDSNFATFVSGYDGLSVAELSKAINGLTPNTTYYYRIRVSGYTNSNTITLTTIAPLAAIETSASEVCVNGTSPTITFTGSGSTAPYQFTYTLNGGSNQTITTISGDSVTLSVPTSVAGTNTYSLVDVTDANNGTHSQSGSAIVAVNLIPSPSFVTKPAATICSGSDVTYSTESGQTNYDWTLTGILGTDYTITSGSTGASSSTVTLKWLTSGDKTVTVNYTSNSSCTGTQASTTSTVNSTPSVASIEGSTTTTVGLSTTLYNPTSDGVWSSSNTSIASINSSGMVTAVSQGIATITYTVTLGNCSTSVNTTYTVTAAPSPTFTSVSPTFAVVGTTITITGTNFLNASSVTLDDNPVSFNVVSDTSITFTLPQGSGSNLAVAVTTHGTTARSTSPNLVTYNTFGVPTITSFSPTSAAAGQTVVITGTNLLNPSTIRFGGTEVASYTVDSSSQITVIIGSGTSGQARVRTQGGTATKNGFTFLTCSANPSLYAGGSLSMMCTATTPFNITADATASNYSALTWTTSGTGSFTNNNTADALTNTTYTPSSADILAGSVTLTLTATSNPGCTDQTSSKTFTINPIAIAVQPTATREVCKNTTSETVSFTSTASDYTIQWYSNSLNSYSAASVISGATRNSFSLPTNVVGTKYYFAKITSSSGLCTVNTDIVSQTVSQSLGSISNISGTAKLSSVTTTAVYAVTPVTGATSYVWDLPSGMTLASQTGASITVNLSSTFTAGTLRVKAINACNETYRRTLSVSRSGVMAAGAFALAVSGVNQLCPDVTEVYTATTVIGGTYLWTVPTNVTIISGQGTSSITISSNSSFGSGQVTVTCTTTRATQQASIKISGATLPSVIAGPTNVCSATQVTYSVASVMGLSYQWTVPSGMTITSGQGTSSISVAITGAVSGSLTVRSISTCGTSAAVVLSVGTTPILGGISGTAIVCGAVQTTIDTGGQIVNNNPLNQYTYTVTALAGVTNYTWSVPAGATLVSGQTTNSIVVSYDLINFESGVIGVQGTNSCGIGIIRTLPVSTITANVTGPTNLCSLTTATYAVPSDAGTNFVWNLPPGMSISSGLGTSSITVAINHPVNFAYSNQVRVQFTTACGGTKTATLTVNCSDYTSLVSSQCGATISPDLRVDAIGAAGVSGYAFDIYDASGSTLITTIENRSNFFRFNQYRGLIYGATYQVKVRLKRGSVYGNAGAACNLTLIDIPAVTLTTIYCGATGVSPSELVRANSISNAAGYRFKIYDATGVNLLKTLDNSAAFFRFNQFNFNYGTTYQVKVQAKQGTVYGAEGAACTVSIQAKAPTARKASEISRATEMNASAFNAIAHPNPFTSTFNLTVSSLSDADIEVRVYDMTGKLIENRKSGLYEIQSLELGSYYLSGVYNVIVSQGENTNTLRVIKK